MFKSKRRSYIVIILIGVLLGFVLPNIFNEMGINANDKIIWLLIVINFVGAYVLGWYIKKTFAPFFTLLIFPALFTITNLVFHTNNRQYAYYLALTYFVISLIAHFHSWAIIENEDDNDENVVTDFVDGGFGSNKE